MSWEGPSLNPRCHYARHHTDARIFVRAAGTWECRWGAFCTVVAWGAIEAVSGAGIRLILAGLALGATVESRLRRVARASTALNLKCSTWTAVAARACQALGATTRVLARWARDQRAVGAIEPFRANFALYLANTGVGVQRTVDARRRTRTGLRLAGGAVEARTLLLLLVRIQKFPCRTFRAL